MPDSHETPKRVPVGTAVVLERDGKILFIKRWGKHGQGSWSVPGGWVDPGEDPIETVCREALEEVGLTVTPAELDFIGYTHDLYPEGVEDVCLWFGGPARGEPEIREPEKIKDLAWRSWDDLPEPLFLGLERALDKGLVGESPRKADEDAPRG